MAMLSVCAIYIAIMIFLVDQRWATAHILGAHLLGMLISLSGRSPPRHRPAGAPFAGRGGRSSTSGPAPPGPGSCRRIKAGPRGHQLPLGDDRSEPVPGIAGFSSTGRCSATPTGSGCS